MEIAQTNMTRPRFSQTNVVETSVQCIMLQDTFRAMLREGTEAIAYSRTGDRGSKEFLYNKVMENLAAQKFNLDTTTEFSDKAPKEFLNTSIKTEFYLLFTAALLDAEKKGSFLMPLEHGFRSFSSELEKEGGKRPHLMNVKECAKSVLYKIDFNSTDIQNMEDNLHSALKGPIDGEFYEVYLETAKEIANARSFFNLL